jgi:hypothetical protein
MKQTLLLTFLFLLLLTPNISRGDFNQTQADMIEAARPKAPGYDYEQAEQERRIRELERKQRDLEWQQRQLEREQGQRGWFQ